MKITPARSHAEQDETQKAAVAAEDGCVLGREAEVAQNRCDLEDALTVGILGAKGPAHAEQVLIVVLELYRVLVLVLVCRGARRGG